MWELIKTVAGCCGDIWIGLIVIALMFGIPITAGIWIAKFFGVL